ncbi:hypothetical protein IMG5_144830, partial [Ichthyophthirius multifiliis]
LKKKLFPLFSFLMFTFYSHLYLYLEQFFFKFQEFFFHQNLFFFILLNILIVQFFFPILIKFFLLFRIFPQFHHLIYFFHIQHIVILEYLQQLQFFFNYFNHYLQPLYQPHSQNQYHILNTLKIKLNYKDFLVLSQQYHVYIFYTSNKIHICQFFHPNFHPLPIPFIQFPIQMHDNPILLKLTQYPVMQNIISPSLLTYFLSLIHYLIGANYYQYYCN